MMLDTRKTGLWGEIYAARYLTEKGYLILATNYRVKSGEIDIVAQKDEIISFVEVKTRSEGQYFDPAEAVDDAKAENVRNAAAAFMARIKKTDKIRFDIIEVLLSEENYKIRHTKNAF